MEPKKYTDCSSDARRCSAADGPQLPMTPDRSADVAFSLAANSVLRFKNFTLLEKANVLASYGFSRCEAVDIWEAALSYAYQQVLNARADENKKAQATEGR